MRNVKMHDLLWAKQQMLHAEAELKAASENMVRVFETGLIQYAGKKLKVLTCEPDEDSSIGIREHCYDGTLVGFEDECVILQRHYGPERLARQHIPMRHIINIEFNTK